VSFQGSNDPTPLKGETTDDALNENQPAWDFGKHIIPKIGWQHVTLIM
jgi:hypothetical protein